MNWGEFSDPDFLLTIKNDSDTFAANYIQKGNDCKEKYADLADFRKSSPIIQSGYKARNLY